METKRRPGVGDAREESALNMFRQMDLKGQTQVDTQLQTVHQNTISTIRVYEEAGGAVRKFSSKYLPRQIPRRQLTDSLNSERSRRKGGYLDHLNILHRAVVLDGLLRLWSNRNHCQIIMLPDHLCYIKLLGRCQVI